MHAYSSYNLLSGDVLYTPLNSVIMLLLGVLAEQPKPPVVNSPETDVASAAARAQDAAAPPQPSAQSLQMPPAPEAGSQQVALLGCIWKH